MPAGTKRWVAPPLGPRTVQNIVQARVVDENTPDFYVEESAGSMGSVIRAFTASGQQKWVWPSNGSPASRHLLAGDNNGGLLAASTVSVSSLEFAAVNKDGVQIWNYSVPLVAQQNQQYAVAADNTVFVLNRSADFNVPVKVVALNGATGQESYSISLPQSTRTWYDGATGKEFTDVGSFVIDGDGALWTSVVVNTFTQAPNLGPWTCTSALNTVKVLNGTPTVTQIDSAAFGPSPDQTCGSKQFAVSGNPVIPDGHSGAMLTAAKPTSTNPAPTVYRSTGAQFASLVGNAQQMLLGENDTVFLRGSTGRAAIALDGTSHWQDSGGGTFQAALGDGSLLVDNGTIKRINSSGQETGFAGGSPMYFTSYFGGDLWLGATELGRLSMTTSSMAFADPAADLIWWLARTLAARQAGNPQEQNAPPIKVGVRVLHVTGTAGTPQFMASQVNSALHVWSYHGIELSWDGTVDETPSCDPIAYPNGCGSNLQLDIAALTTVETAQEIARRFCSSPPICFDGKRVSLIFNDRVSMGIGNANGWTGFSGSTDSPRYWNLSLIPTNAEGNDTAHEIGHEFQLTHAFWAWPNNLMCSNPAICPVHPGSALSADQVKKAQGAAEKLK